MTSEAEFLKCYSKIKLGYSEVIKHIDASVTLEEEENNGEALRSYTKCIEAIDAIFAIPVGLPDNVESVQSQWNDACNIIQKLKTFRSEVIYRRSCLESKATVDQCSEVSPESDLTEPTESEACATGATTKISPNCLTKNSTPFAIANESGIPMTYRQIIKGLRVAIGTEESPLNFDTIFESNAKLYKIQPNGSVTSAENGTQLQLAIIGTDSPEWKYLNNMYFIHCQMTAGTEPSNHEMSWVYPLVPGVTTCFRTEYGAYIFPDMEADEPGTAFGIILEGQEPEYNQFWLDLIEAIITGEVLELKEGPSRTKRDVSTTVSKTIVGTADFIAKNLVKGAEKTGELMVKSTPYLISKMSQAPPDTPPVSSKVQTSVEVAKNVSGAAVGVTGYIAGKVGCATMAIGRFLAPHIKNQGANILSVGFGLSEEDAQDKMQGAFTIAAGAVEGFSTVFNGLEESAKILGTNLSNNSVKIIEHKYGPSAGQVASGTFDTLGNAFTVSQNVKYITPKGIARRVAKSTGKGVFEIYKNGQRPESHYVPAGVLYPDLSELKEQYSKK
ncbi:protein spartin isoform X1 [Episyrphus balteatus]|nr:protein spartin isoform X1 [Episyrphus balteatus]XP_055852725.1 protein spartin isoform X1 [Episyrphus balteatus]XP_055852726.1 protein spartin isoform X1 [Episyrphus balteatus]